jgi:hypothetical protein
LVLRLLTPADLGMYYLFNQFAMVVVLLDFGFSPTFGRFASYAMGGAKKFASRGVLTDEPPHGAPNFPMLWELLGTARMFYRYVAFGTVLLLGTGGTLNVWSKVHETSHPLLTWLAWAVCVLATGVEGYFNIWNVFLRGMNQVVSATRISVFAYALRLVIACALLLAGTGLLAVPAASLITSIAAGLVSRARCLKMMGQRPDTASVDYRSHLRTIWPNAWRLGLYFAGSYFSTTANMLLCSMLFGLEANARYGLSLQVVNIASGMAAVWTFVKWPIAGQLVAKQDISGLRQLLWPRFWLQFCTFAILAVAGVTLGPQVVHFIGKDKEMLPLLWLILLALNGFLEAHVSFWNTLISWWNELPMVRASLAGNILGLVINVVLVSYTAEPEPGLLAIGPLAAGLLYNYWHWPIYGARKLATSWPDFLRGRFAAIQQLPASP